MPVSETAANMYEGSEKYLKAVDLKGGERTLTITDANETTFKNGDRQIALSFAGEVKTLGLNKTNFTAIAYHYGKDPNGWNGRQIVAFATTTANQSGQIVPCVRVRIPNGQAAPQPAIPPAEKSALVRIVNVKTATRPDGTVRFGIVTEGEPTLANAVIGTNNVADGNYARSCIPDRATVKVRYTFDGKLLELVGIERLAQAEPGQDVEDDIRF